MPRNSDIIISDTSCLILLSKIDELSLLQKVADNVVITSMIQLEFGKKLPSSIRITRPKG